jgi:hypothetical protein
MFFRFDAASTLFVTNTPVTDYAEELNDKAHHPAVHGRQGSERLDKDIYGMSFVSKEYLLPTYLDRRS